MIYKLASEREIFHSLTRKNGMYVWLRDHSKGWVFRGPGHACLLNKCQSATPHTNAPPPPPTPPPPQCANHLYANRNLRYSKLWPSFLLWCFWRVFCVYEDLILLWFCLLDSIFKQHYYLRQFIWSEVLCFSISCLNHQTWREFRRITCLLVTWH